MNIEGKIFLLTSNISQCLQKMDNAPNQKQTEKKKNIYIEREKDEESLLYFNFIQNAAD